jgi:hypothetical protein
MNALADCYIRELGHCDTRKKSSGFCEDDQNSSPLFLIIFVINWALCALARPFGVEYVIGTSPELSFPCQYLDHRRFAGVEMAFGDVSHESCLMFDLESV